ncbi:MAG: ATP-binding protein [Desulfococcaceae bacterium]|nr:ATP-binding protein [Desulfococcaceae bacterium]
MPFYEKTPGKAKHGLNLRLQIYLILFLLVLVVMMGGFVTVWHTFHIERLVASVIEKHLSAFEMAGEMEIALVNQKGFASYYFLDGDPDWLRQLGEYRQIFLERLEKARSNVNSRQQEETLDKIEAEYRIYVQTKDRVIQYYKNGEREAGSRLHHETRKHFFPVLDLCEEYKHLLHEKMLKEKKENLNQAMKIRFVAFAGIFLVFFLSILLVFVLIRYILNPVRLLTREAKQQDLPYSSGDNEIAALSRSVRGLIRDAGQTHMELQKSRKHLMQSEKMVIVGKLAAGTAHSIRNPLTSVKMRLFSLHRSLKLTESQKEDFEVISDEIRHIDTIVQNFLEFSRPPKLNMQNISPSAVVDNAVQLLKHRLKSYDVEVKIERKQVLPEIKGDFEQLKEVLVNLIINACEAMTTSGTIRIKEDIISDSKSDIALVIKISDSGPGIDSSMKEKIFEPFFTSKDEGTGLGLSIAMRIIEEHKGLLDLDSEENQGATFTITLPLNHNNSYMVEK